MKYFILFFISSFILFEDCHLPDSQKNNFADTDSSYTITGDIKGLDSGFVYLDNRRSGLEDSAIAVNGHFIFKGKTSSQPEFCLLGIIKNGEKHFNLDFFIERGKINITGTKDSINRAKITGTPIQLEYADYQKGISQYTYAFNESIETAIGKKDKGTEDSLMKISNNGPHFFERPYVISYSSHHPSSYVSCYEIYWHFRYAPDIEKLDSAYNSLALDMKNSYYGKKIKNVLDIAKKTAVGNPALDFTQNDTSGKSISLASFKGRYVLVDFWASWCGPCRAENPNLLKAYKKYHPKGFDILGVSLDENKNEWKEAVKKDDLNWSQVSDLQGWKNSVALQYNVLGIPTNFLVDKDGKIIAKGLRGDELDKKLEEVLK
jgi:peroxiredoxin